MEENVIIPHNSLLMVNDFLESFVQERAFPAAIKDAKTGRYTVCNHAASSLAGLPPEGYIGLNAYDVREMLNIQKEITDHAISMDRKIIQDDAQFLCYKHVWFTKSKTIFIEEVIKRPVLGHKNKTTAILAYGRDVTLYASPPYLFRLYEMHLPPKEAIRSFLHHMNMDNFFFELPTKKELLALLAMRKTAISKYVARDLGITSRAVDEYKARLRAKLNIVDIDEILIRLRLRYEYKGFL